MSSRTEVVSPRPRSQAFAVVEVFFSIAYMGLLCAQLLVVPFDEFRPARYSAGQAHLNFLGNLTRR